MEWIILDDGTDKIKDLVSHIPQVKYYEYDTKMPLGKKRNLMHKKCSGKYIVYMDDDDYYPPTRVSHAVEKLEKHPEALCSGSSIIYIYFKHIQQMYQFGPYGPNHSTAASFAFRRKLLDITEYDENACLAEEKKFLKDYTIPFVQLDPMHTLLVFSHVHNTFDKKTLLDSSNNFIKVSNLTVEDFIQNKVLREFYKNNVNALLEDYECGKPAYKPDVIKQIEELKFSRQEQMISEYQRMLNEIHFKMNNVINENIELKKKVSFLEEKLKEIIQTKITEKKTNTF